MVRLMRTKEVALLAEIWLAASLIAHDFIPAAFWRARVELIKTAYLGKSITYVYEEKGELLGFISFAQAGKIGGIFVAPAAQGRGVGFALINQAKKLFNELELEVYARNVNAVHFYLRQDFQAILSYQGKDTGEASYRMRWSE